MYSESKEIAYRIENLNCYLESNRERFASIDEAFFAGYKKALEDAVNIMKEIKQSQS